MESSPRIIIFDIETLPHLQEALKVWPQLSQWPGKTLKATISTIVCAAYKIHGQKSTEIIKAWDFSSWADDVNDDKNLCLELRKVLSTADCIVTQNGRKFDWKFLQTRFLYHKIPPLPDIPHVDIRLLASRNLLSFNNRLGYMSRWLFSDTKLPHEGWDLWCGVYERREKCMAKMAKYCIKDVQLTDKIFKVYKPFAKNIPNYNLYIRGKKPICPSCGSTRLKSNGYRFTKTSAYKRLICTDCQSWSRLDAKGLNPRSV